ncbi:MAG TPA: SIS domain-containing protein [Rhodothermia bacterium]|nr:SIS domain-containing protein [Rhodothermia bacterium]
MTRRPRGSPSTARSSAGDVNLTEYFRAHEEVVAKSADSLADAAQAAARAIIECLEGGAKVICFGNGGSATQASHLAAELVGRFRATRRPLPAVSLASDGGTMTCIGNDFGYPALFERQMEAFAQPGDVAIGLTTSGKSENVVRALAIARSRGAVTIALTGSAGLSGERPDHLLSVPSSDTAHIQEIHLMVLHAWCVAIDEAFG